MSRISINHRVVNTRLLEDFRDRRSSDTRRIFFPDVNFGKAGTSCGGATMKGQWRAAEHRNRRTQGHTVHFQTSPGMALCGRILKYSREPTIDGTEWNIDHPSTCKGCKSWYTLFYAGRSVNELNNPPK
jgi:hypothetical protein